MRVIKQKDRLKVDSFDNDDCHTSAVSYKHSKLFPNSIRSIICGPSNCGKTNIMISLLVHPNGLKFNNVYVYSKSLYQPKYQFLECVLKNVPEMKYFPFKENEEILDSVEALPHSVFLFDDVLNSKQDKIRDYFSMGRHKFIDSFYLCQSYAKIPKHLIRDNANFLVIFKQDDLNLRHIYDEHVGVDMTFEQFKHLCFECWKDKYGFLVIDKDRDLYSGRYRKQFDSYIVQF